MKILNILFLMLSLTIIVADAGFFDTPYSHHLICPSGKASDVSNSIEHAHANGVDHNFIVLSFSQKPRLASSQSAMYPELNLPATCTYSTTIWQPPKSS